MKPTRLKQILAGVVLVFALIIGVVAFMASSAPPITRIEVAENEQACITAIANDSCLRFPLISGLNLRNAEMTFPTDFVGDYNFVIVPFSDEQQVNAETWLPLARELAEANPSLKYYNIPVFPDINPAIRVVIRAGLVVAIADPELQAISVTVFLENRDAFLAALNIPDVEAIQVFLVNREGDVLWRGSGLYDDTQGELLRRFVEKN